MQHNPTCLHLCFLCRPQRLEDVQCLNLRYRATSVMCVPVPCARAAAEGSAAGNAADVRLTASASSPSVGSLPAAGCITIGFSHGTATSLAQGPNGLALRCPRSLCYSCRSSVPSHKNLPSHCLNIARLANLCGLVVTLETGHMHCMLYPQKYICLSLLQPTGGDECGRCGAGATAAGRCGSGAAAPFLVGGSERL